MAAVSADLLIGQDIAGAQPFSLADHARMIPAMPASRRANPLRGATLRAKTRMQ
jgi:hypothetical protein